ncbi:MAG: hypothetical protein K9N46_02245 [Candidatus Marinimicrobia bacterium]|nr:hypothetical protein [Candidatus Neomarinimicrobiota bacterium]MCF7828281.1 hypothetical protein [Candidatus Neomarinimicrobiota bacterium]MCF7879544.1 hypothetical protein [Candidatus Neomarinimicrobiota bacterium]
MRIKIYPLSRFIFLLLLISTISSCDSLDFLTDSKKSDEPDNTITIQGVIIDKSTEDSLPDAVIRIISPKPEINTQSDSAGHFTLSVEIDSTVTLTLMFYKEGYQSDTTSVLAIPGRDVELPDVQLSPDRESKTTISGKVLLYTDQSPVQNATVRIFSPLPQQTTTTGIAGEYGFTVEIDSLTEYTLIATKNEMEPDTVSFTVTPHSDNEAPTLIIRAEESQTVPASIVLSSLSETTISVQSTGTTEIASITFEVQDSLENPVKLKDSIAIQFTLGASPQGGEILYPQSTIADDDGLVTTRLFSGTKAGVVQVVAQYVGNGKTIRSQPVPLTIQGGLPDSNHFHVVSEQLNYALPEVGESISITALAGDKYGNIVPPETAIYFTTDGGIIEGQGITGDNGQTTVSLYYTKPFPVHPVFGEGYTTITAQTADENNNTIEAHTIVLFSGKPIISEVTPDTFHLAKNGSQNFSYSVSDTNMNPLAETTTIAVTADPDNLELIGDVDVTLSDTQERGAGTTNFNFVISNPDTSSTSQTKQGVVTISVDGPNGSTEQKIYGSFE